jgi:Lysylphosphatidylglycerol synthase TM region
MHLNFKIFIKTVLLITFATWIYFQIKGYTFQGESIADRVDLDNNNIFYSILVLILVPVNWYLEAIKWKLLCKPYGQLSSNQAIRSVLSGLSLGILTPGRIGEYGGRILATPITSKSGIVSATFVGSMAQNICNIGIGFLLSVPLIQQILGNKTMESNWSYGLIFLQIIMLIVLYFNMHRCIVWVGRWMKISRFNRYFAAWGNLEPYTNGVLINVLIWSICRYMLYFLQYAMLMKFLGVETSFIDLVSGVAAIYMIQSMVPLPAFLSILARGELAILVWSIFGVSPLVSITATFSLWITNLIIPACFGMIFLIKSDLWSFESLKQRQNDKI